MEIDVSKINERFCNDLKGLYAGSIIVGFNQTNGSKKIEIYFHGEGGLTVICPEEEFYIGNFEPAIDQVEDKIKEAIKEWEKNGKNTLNLVKKM